MYFAQTIILTHDHNWRVLLPSIGQERIWDSVPSMGFTKRMPRLRRLKQYLGEKAGKNGDHYLWPLCFDMRFARHRLPSNQEATERKSYMPKSWTKYVDKNQAYSFEEFCWQNTVLGMGLALWAHMNKRPALSYKQPRQRWLQWVTNIKCLRLERPSTRLMQCITGDSYALSNTFGLERQGNFFHQVKEHD